MTITTDFEKIKENKVPIAVISAIVLTVIIIYFVYLR